MIYLGIGLGHKNVVLESTHPDLRDLYEFTQSCLHLPEVLEYETIQVLDIKKSVWDWSPLNPYATEAIQTAPLGEPAPVHEAESA